MQFEDDSEEMGGAMIPTFWGLKVTPGIECSAIPAFDLRVTAVRIFIFKF